MTSKTHTSDEDARCVVINLPKSRNCKVNSSVFAKKKNILRITQKSLRKPSGMSLKKYSLPGRVPISVSIFKREEMLLPYRLFVRQQEKDKFKHHLCIKSREYYKVINTDLGNRLHTEDPPYEYHAMTDVDPDFFSCVNGCPLVKYAPAYKSLRYLFNGQIRLRQEVGYRNDCTLNITINNRKELMVYGKNIQRYKEQVKLFDDFISYDYQKSMLSLCKWDRVKSEVIKKISELQLLATEMFTTTSRIIGLDYRYGLQQKYGRFLYYLSPPSWRSKNRTFARSIEIEEKGFDYRNPSEEDTFNVIFEKLQRECSDGLVKPVLYFTQPEDLMRIFDGIEQQQLHHFKHVASLVPHTKSLKQGIKYLNDIISQDSAPIDNIIKVFTNQLRYSEERSFELEAKFFKILNGMFFDNVGAPEVLKFQQHLEYYYERLYNEKPMNMGMFAVAKAIEHVYMDYSKRLDAITSSKIKQALQRCINMERQKFKKAKMAARELRLFERLERDLLRAHEPSAARKYVPAQRVTHNVVRKKYSKPAIIERNRQSLSEAQKEYLLLFTDWTEKEDPAKYLQSLTISVDKS